MLLVVEKFCSCLKWCFKLITFKGFGFYLENHDMFVEVTDVSTALVAVIFRVKRRVNIRFACICIWLMHHKWEIQIQANLTFTLLLTLKMTATKAVEMSVTSTNSLSQDYTNLVFSTLQFLDIHTHDCSAVTCLRSSFKKA